LHFGVSATIFDALTSLNKRQHEHPHWSWKWKVKLVRKKERLGSCYFAGRLKMIFNVVRSTLHPTSAFRAPRNDDPPSSAGHFQRISEKILNRSDSFWNEHGALSWLTMVCDDCCNVEEHFLGTNDEASENNSIRKYDATHAGPCLNGGECFAPHLGRFFLDPVLQVWWKLGAKHSPSHIHFKNTKGGRTTLQRKSILLGTFKGFQKRFCLLFSEPFRLILERT
jgi:hypothetical protein